MPFSQSGTTIFSIHRPTTFSQSKKSDQLVKVSRKCCHLSDRINLQSNINDGTPMNQLARNSKTAKGYVRFAFLLSSAFMILLAGCISTEQDKLAGVWQIEQAEEIADQINASEDEANNESLPPRMTIEFSNGGKLKTTTIMGEIDRTKEGSWSLVSYDETNQVSVIKCTIGLQETEHEVDWIDDNTIEIVPPNMAGVDMKLRFTKRQ